MIEQMPREEIRDITDTVIAGMSDHARDEMAIPSYLHGNPFIRWLMWRRYTIIARFLDGTAGTSALEFGCGLGLFLPELTRRFQDVAAIDLFPDYAIELSVRQQLAVRFAANLGNIADNSLDVIIAADVLEHIEDLPAYLTEFALKLKSDGRLVVSGPTESALYKLGRIAAGFAGKGDYHHTNIDRLVVEITDHGFTHTRTARLPFALLPCLFKVCEFVKAGTTA
jgi:2-polyprenyl-3-methyl-5-hydroxy-6-metoxy-1,4-benzoquinol methylase